MNPSALITIVITLKNRFEHFAKCVKAIFRSEHGPIELLVVDFGSDDGDVAGMIKYLGFPARVVPIRGPFNQNVGRNRGARDARGEIILQLDADMTVPATGFFSRIREVVKPGMAFFPICAKRVDEHGELISDIHIELGYGLSALTKRDIAKVGYWDEDFTAWGYDDNEFRDRLKRDTDIAITRSRVGVIHLYHPNTWEHRNKYTECPDATSYMKKGQRWAP